MLQSEHNLFLNVQFQNVLDKTFQMLQNPAIGSLCRDFKASQIFGGSYTGPSSKPIPLRYKKVVLQAKIFFIQYVVYPYNKR